MADDDGQQSTQQMTKSSWRKRLNRENKLVLVFDEQARKYVTPRYPANAILEAVDDWL